MMPMTDESCDTVTIIEIIPAARDDVWRAWTTPEEKKIWWGRSENLVLSLCEMDVRVGGKYRYGMAPAGTADVTEAANGTYQVVESKNRLVYTWNWGGENPSVSNTLVTVLFEVASENSTRVTVIHERQPDARVAGIHHEGWTYKLADLVMFAAKA